MAISQTNVKDFAGIFLVGAVVGAGALFVFNNIKSITGTAGTLTKPTGLSPTTDSALMDPAKAAKLGIYDDEPYISNASYFWDFRNPYLSAGDNVLYNKAPYIELQSTSEFDPNNPKVIGSYSASCASC